MRVYLHQFNTPTNRNLLPLAIGKLASYIKADSTLSGRVALNLNILRETAETVIESYDEPDVIGFSVYMWNLAHTLEVAKLAKEKYPSAMIVFGGPSTFRDEDELNDFFGKYGFVDVSVIGEGEITFVALLHSILRNQPLETVGGIAFQREGAVILNGLRQRERNLDVLPSPFLDGTFDELLARHPNVFTGVVWETTRGCPFTCSFCDWGQATHAVVTEYSTKRLEAELEWMAQNKIFYVFLADANFGIKKRDATVATFMADQFKKHGFPGVYNLSWVKNSSTKVIEISEILREAGIQYQVTLSMQSFSAKVLEAISRKNIPLETFFSLKKEMNSREMNTYTEILLGLPEETYDSFTDGLTKSLSPTELDHFIIYLVRLLENTEMNRPDYIDKFGIMKRTCKTAHGRRTLDDDALSEYEVIVVGTSAMPERDWHRSYVFGYFLAGLYNLRLLNVFMNFLRNNQQVDLKKFTEFIIDYADNNEPTVKRIVDDLFAMGQTILDGGKSVSQVEEFGKTYWDPHEICFLIVSSETNSFYNDILSITKRFFEKENLNYSLEVIGEAVQFQKLLTPVYGNMEFSEHDFKHDWKRHYDSIDVSGKLLKKDVCLCFEPPITNHANKLDFTLKQLGRSNTGSGLSCFVSYK